MGALVFSSWVQWFQEWTHTNHDSIELAVPLHPNNTKMTGYSRIIEEAKLADPDFFWLLETNHQLRVPIAELLKICERHEVCFTPSVHDGVLRAAPPEPWDGKMAPPTDAAWKSRGGGSAFVSIDQARLRELKGWYWWKEGPHPLWIYCFPGLHEDGAIYTEDYSLFANLARTGANIVAEPAIHSENFRLKGSPSYGYIPDP